MWIKLEWDFHFYHWCVNSVNGTLPTNHWSESPFVKWFFCHWFLLSTLFVIFDPNFFDSLNDFSEMYCWTQQKMTIFYHTSFIEALFTIHNHNPLIQLIKSEIDTLYFYNLFFTQYKKTLTKLFFNKTKRNVRWVDYTYFPCPKESQKFHRQHHGIGLKFPQVRKSKKLQL